MLMVSCFIEYIKRAGESNNNVTHMFVYKARYQNNSAKLKDYQSWKKKQKKKKKKKKKKKRKYNF